ncbi:MAG: hypothetical protein ACR2QH_16360 [Geminicoccaceae bacterium]
MEQDFSTRTINQTAALHIPAIREAYDRAGIACRPVSQSILSPVFDRLKTLVTSHQILNRQQWAS